MLDRAGLAPLLRDTRVRRLLVANTLGSIGSGVTIFSVPWILVHREGGNQAYLWTTIATTLALFVAAPYYGSWVDRSSRKTTLLTSEAFGFVATLTMALMGLALGGFALWQLAAVYFLGMLYYTLHYPAKFAFIQQIFDRSQYQSLTGLLEIQGQTAMMIAGGLGGLLVEQVPLWGILLFDAGTYLVSFLVQSTIPYTATHLQPQAGAVSPAGPVTEAVASGAAGARLAPVPAAKRASPWSGVAAGWQWLRERPQLNIFLTCALIPFIIVMAGNYLFPIYVSQTLQASARWFAGGEIAFAVGAIAAGALLPRLIAQRSAFNTIPITMVAFGVGLLIVVTCRFPLAFLVASALLGFGNSGSRVARNALMLHIVPNALMGRVGGYFAVLDRILRTLLLFAVGVSTMYGPPAGYMILLGVLLLALFGVYQTRSALRAAHASSAPA